MKVIAFARLSAICLLTTSCLYPDHAPAWVDDLVSSLECGMSLAEVESLSDRELKVIEAKSDLGTHQIDGKMADIWLGFEQGKLTTLTSGYIDGVASSRRTPVKNLCTGDLTFEVTVEWIDRLEGADVYWNGELVQKNASSGISFSASAGAHELHVVKEGFEPIVRNLSLNPEDAGEQWIELLEAVSKSKS